MPALYRTFATQAEIDAEYDSAARCPGFDLYMQQYDDYSCEAAARLAVTPDLPYGPTLDEYLDFYPASGVAPGTAAPLLVFFHGGDWSMLDSKGFSFVAPGVVESGISIAIVNYSLCPFASLDELVRQCRASIAWLYRAAGELNVDRDRIAVAGHSAGGHLAAMCLLTDWAGQYGLPERLVCAALLVSGTYDLYPIRYSYLQPLLQLTEETVRRNSPLLHRPADFARTLVAYGAEESDETRRQAMELTAVWGEAGMEIDTLARDGMDHFSVMFDFRQADSVLMKRLRNLLEMED